MARVPNARLAALALCAVLGLTLASGVEVGAATSLRASARDDAAAAAAQDADADADADPLSIARMRWNALWDGAVGASRVQAAAAEPASPVHQDQTLRANVVLVLLLGMLLVRVRPHTLAGWRAWASPHLICAHASAPPIVRACASPACLPRACARAAGRRV